MIEKSLSFIAKIIWIKELGLLNGVALILSIYVHEYGHYFMASELQLKPKHPVFIPFLGAYVKHKESFDNKQIFKVAFSGPLFGGILGVFSFYIYLVFHSNFFHQIALYSLILNFANLIPFAILDGAHIVKTLGFNKLQLFFTISIVVIAVFTKKYIFIVFGLLGFINYLYTFSVKDKLKPMNKEDKDFGVFLYLGLFITLGIHTYFIIK
jgi:Zn-dependent protease